MRVESLELDEFSVTELKGKPVISDYLELLKNVKVNLDVVVGSADIAVSELLSLKENSIINLDKDLAAPLDIVLDGKVIARGKLAVAEEKFAIQITEVSNSVKNFASK